MTRTFITFAALLSFSFGGGLIGGYIGGLHAARGQQRDISAMLEQIDHTKSVSVNMVASLATDTEILAGDIVDLNQRLNVLNVLVQDMVRPGASR
ncbi:MAG: hypothetical protein VW600_02195 [Ferrovibrio sp.]